MAARLFVLQKIGTGLVGFGTEAKKRRPGYSRLGSRGTSRPFGVQTKD